MKKFSYVVICILTIFIQSRVFAAGGVTVSTSFITMEQGDSSTFKITADNAAGTVTLNSSNES